MESFFALLQKNALDRRTWATREELRIAIVTWIERTYHRRRKHDARGRLTPIQFETKMTTPAKIDSTIRIYFSAGITVGLPIVIGSLQQEPIIP